MTFSGGEVKGDGADGAIAFSHLRSKFLRAGNVYFIMFATKRQFNQSQIDFNQII